ncbi:MAG: (d)CMP kinase [Patescibacteria group bacterium]
MGTYIKYLKKFEKPFKKKGLTITISGLSGSGKSTVAEIIAKEFKLKIFSAGDIQRKFASQRKISIYESSIIRPKKIDYEMDKTLLNLAMKGGYVLIGRLAAWVAGDWADCKIYVNCQKKIRAKRVAKRDNLTFKEALIKITKRDEADKKRYWDLYRINIDKKKIFDIFIDNSKPTLKELKRETIKKVKKFLKNYGNNKNN